MRFFVPVNSTPCGIVSGLGNHNPVTSVQVKRRDKAAFEVQFFNGEQGAAQPYKLADNFEIRFACKVVDAWTGDAVVLEQSFSWRPTDQVYVATPNFNTLELNALFTGDPEPKEVRLMAEFSWRSLSDLNGWSSTLTFEVVVLNDVIRGDEGDPSSAEDPTQYVTRDELGTGYVRTDVAQSLSPEQKAQACTNIGAVTGTGVVQVAAQSLTPEQKTQVQTNIGAAAQSSLDTTNATAAALAVVVAGKASNGSVAAVSASVAALDALVLKKTEQTLSDAEKLQVLTNIGAASAASERPYPRLTTSWQAVGNGTTVHLNGAVNSATGTATTRNVTLLDAGHTISAHSGTTITSNGHGGVNNQAAQFTASLMPSPLVAGTWYYLRDVTANTFAVALTPGGAAITLSGSYSGFKVFLALGSFHRHRRLGYVGSAAAGSAAGTRHSMLQWAVSAEPGMGRWTFSARFGISDAAAVANARTFVGLTGIAAGGVLPNANPSAQVNLIGMGSDTGDTTFRIMHNDASGTATRIDLGANFPCNTRNEDMYQLTLTCNADLTVTYKVINLTTGNTAAGNLASDLPMNLTLLAPQLWRNNGSTALAVGLDVVQWAMEGP